MNRREFALAAAASLAFGRDAGAEEAKEIRIGYQKGGILPLLKQQGRLEQRFGTRGIAVKWVEFPYGPPLLEALNVGSVDFGSTGDAPPVFAQAARANLLYVAALPASGSGEAILVPQDSPIRALGDLKGKRIGFAKGSSSHNTTLAVLETAGLAYGEITPVYLPPADAASAFARGAIDAWTIWDPFYAIAQRGKVRVLVEAKDVHRQNAFFLANRDFATKHADLVAAFNEEAARASQWASGHLAEVAAFLSEATGVDAASERVAVDRSLFLVTPVTEEIAAEQQKVADRFHRLGLIPKPVAVRDIVWTWTPAF